MEFLEHAEGIAIYRSFLDAEGVTPFHTPAWLRFVQRTLSGSRIRFLTWHEGDYPVGIMPVVERRRFGLTAAFSVPFDAPGGPLGTSPPQAWSSFFSGYWHVRIADPRGVLACDWPHISVPIHIIHLSGGTVARSQLKAARQAEKRGLEIERMEGFTEEIYSLYLRVKSQRGGLVYTKETLRRLFSEMGPLAFGFTARIHGRAVAFILNFWHGPLAVSYLHGFDRDAARARPMSSLVLRSLEEARALGCDRFSLGSTDPRDRGAALFKESFGAVAVPMRIYIKGKVLSRLLTGARNRLLRKKGL